MQQVVFRGSRAELRALLGTLPAMLAGRARDPSGNQIVRQMQLRLGVALLSQVQQDYVAKARGGVGKDGIKWKPLAPQTLARRRSGKPGKRVGMAAARAGAQHEILRDTNRLFRSLSPGVEDRPSGAAGQVFRLQPGQVIVGTNVVYAATHQRGDADRNIPARPFLPVAALPAAYWPAIVRALVRGLARAVELASLRPRG